MQVQRLQVAAWKSSVHLKRANRLFDVGGDKNDTRMFLVMKESAKVEILGLADSDQDYWSPQQTAKRILDLAKSLSGGDPSKIELLRNAVIQGFKEAERILGSLPGVCDETFDIVMRGFDSWEKESGLNAIV